MNVFIVEYALEDHHSFFGSNHCLARFSFCLEKGWVMCSGKFHAGWLAVVAHNEFPFDLQLFAEEKPNRQLPGGDKKLAVKDKQLAVRAKQCVDTFGWSFGDSLSMSTTSLRLSDYAACMAELGG